METNQTNAPRDNKANKYGWVENPAIWIGSSEPTKAQVDEIAIWGYNLVAVNEGVALGLAATLDVDWDEVKTWEKSLAQLARETYAKAIFGSFPHPWQGARFIRDLSLERESGVGEIDSHILSFRRKGEWAGEFLHVISVSGIGSSFVNYGRFLVEWPTQTSEAETEPGKMDGRTTSALCAAR